jgi:hypothetical protein
MITFETKKHDQLADKLLQKGPCDFKEMGFYNIQLMLSKIVHKKNVLLNVFYFNNNKKQQDSDDF